MAIGATRARLSVGDHRQSMGRPSAGSQICADPARYTNASAVSAGAGPYFRGAIVKLARPWLTLRTAAE